MITRLGCVLSLCLLLATSLPARTQEATVVRLSLHDTVQPVSAEYLERGLQAAASMRARLVLISLGTPGGLLDSTRLMVEAIEKSPVPVAVFIAPSGSRAGSAGFFLLESADVAAMAPVGPGSTPRTRAAMRSRRAAKRSAWAGLTNVTSPRA